MSCSHSNNHPKSDLHVHNLLTTNTVFLLCGICLWTVAVSLGKFWHLSAVDRRTGDNLFALHAITSRAKCQRLFETWLQWRKGRPARGTFGYRLRSVLSQSEKVSQLHQPQPPGNGIQEDNMKWHDVILDFCKPSFLFTHCAHTQTHTSEPVCIYLLMG